MIDFVVEGVQIRAINIQKRCEYDILLSSQTVPIALVVGV